MTYTSNYAANFGEAIMSDINITNALIPKRDRLLQKMLQNNKTSKNMMAKINMTKMLLVEALKKEAQRIIVKH